MNLNLRKFLNLILALLIFINTIPLNSFAADETRTPYITKCEDDVLQILEAGQLEAFVLSTERSEAELIQILKDNYILMSPLFIKAFLIVIEPKLKILKDLKQAKLQNLRKLALRAFAIFKNKSISNSDIDQIFEQMEILASSSTDSDSTNRTIHLIVKRTLDAIRKNTTNRDHIYEIYRKISAQLTAGIGLAYTEILTVALRDSIYSSGNRSKTLVLLPPLSGIGITMLASLLETPMILLAGFPAFLAINIVRAIQVRILESPQLTSNLSEAYKNPALGLEANAILEFAKMPLQGLFELSQLNSNLDLSQLTLTEAAYTGHNDIFDLNVRYQKLNEIFQSSPAKNELQSMRAAAQSVLQNPEKYSARMRFARHIEASIEILEQFYKTQRTELEDLSKTLENLKYTLTQLENSPYANRGKISEEDILKGDIILNRFKAELKRLNDQAIHNAALEIKLEKTKDFLNSLSALRQTIPDNSLGWEEAAQKIILDIDTIIAGSHL